MIWEQWGRDLGVSSMTSLIKRAPVSQCTAGRDVQKLEHSSSSSMEVARNEGARERERVAVAQPVDGAGGGDMDGTVADSL